MNAHAHNTINNWIKKIHGEKRQPSVTEELKIMNVERTRETELHHNDGCEQSADILRRYFRAIQIPVSP